jgi:hypothetical protein
MNQSRVKNPTQNLSSGETSKETKSNSRNPSNKIHEEAHPISPNKFASLVESNLGREDEVIP